MEDLKSLETGALIDMLADHTSQFTKMLSEGATDEKFKACETTINCIQLEIFARKNYTVTDNNVNFDEGQTIG